LEKGDYPATSKQPIWELKIMNPFGSDSNRRKFSYPSISK